MQNRKRDTDVQNRLLDSVGEDEDGMFRENSTETSILSKVRQAHRIKINGGEGWHFEKC